MIASPPSTPVPGSRHDDTSGPRLDGDSDRRRRRRRLLTAVGAAALPVILGGCNAPTFFGYRGSTTQGHDEFLLYSGTVIAAIVVGVITAGLILWAVIRYRRKNDAIPRQFQYHIPLEIFYTAVPIVIVLVLFGFTVYTENKVDNVAPNPAVTVKVTAFQWGWRFDYTNQKVYVQGVRTDNPDPVGLNGKTCTASAPTANDCLGPALVVPVGQTVRIDLVSNDVVHGFYVPQFNFSKYALPGHPNLFDLNVKHSGIYRGQCSQLCGLYHSQMFFHVVALPPAQFDAWVTGTQPQSLTASIGSSIGAGTTGSSAAASTSSTTASSSTTTGTVSASTASSASSGATPAGTGSSTGSSATASSAPSSPASSGSTGAPGSSAAGSAGASPSGGTASATSTASSAS